MDGPIFTYLIIALTCVVSYCAFRNQALEDRFIFDPQIILAGREYHRVVTSAFLHAGWGHLLFNMLSLYLFGSSIELRLGPAQFLLIYFSSVIGGSLLSLYVHRNHQYLAYGASGGVCGIIFTSILIAPTAGIYSFPIPFPIPGWLYAIVFMVGSFFAMRANNKGGIGHDAHLGGAIVGFLTAAALNPGLVRHSPGIFATILGISVLLWIYLWTNPLLLPVTSFFGSGIKTQRRKASLPKHKRETLQIDSILDKIARQGIESLTSEEKALLDEVSGKYRRRGESKKPESGLSI